MDETSKIILNLAYDNLVEGKISRGDYYGTLSVLYKAEGKLSEEQLGEELPDNFVLNNSATIVAALNTGSQTRTFDSSRKMHNADTKGILNTPEHRDFKNGKESYRVTANRDALRELGVQPDSRAEKDFNHRLSKNGKKWSEADFDRARTNQTILKAADNQGLFTSHWTDTGQRVLDVHPEMQYLNKNVDVKHVVTSTAKGAGQGLIDGFTEPFKTNVSKLSGVSKSFGAAGVGLSYYSNFSDAKSDGLTSSKAAARATQDTVIDTAVGSAVQGLFTAAGTAAIPIPGVGTAVGAIAGIAANSFLNYKWGANEETGKEGTSAMDVVKGWFH